MERDEVATLATLSSHRAIVDALIASYKGRITGTAGDSVLAEFHSVVDALDCAVRMQEAVAAANQRWPSEHRLVFRIGLNVGDVMVKDGDIFGDGVNIAARLETLAEPGGICVSRGVRDQVRKLGRFVFTDLGEQKVKNIAQPIRAFAVRVGETPAPIAEEEPGPPAGPVIAQGAIPEFELAFWDSVKDSQDARELEAYLGKYPDGAFTALAEARRAALLAAPEPEEETAPAPELAPPDLVAIELAFWETVKDSDNPAMFDAYLAQYPGGAFAVLARVRLAELRGDPAASPSSRRDAMPQ